MLGAESSDSGQVLTRQAPYMVLVHVVFTAELRDSRIMPARVRYETGSKVVNEMHAAKSSDSRITSSQV